MAHPKFNATTSRLARLAHTRGTMVKKIKKATITKLKYPGLPKLVPAAATPLTTIFFEGTITQGIKQVMINNNAAANPSHFKYRIR